MVPARHSRRLIPSTLLALLLAMGTVAGAVGRDATPRSVDPASPVGVVAGEVKAAVGTTAVGAFDPGPRYDGRTPRTLAAPVAFDPGPRYDGRSPRTVTKAVATSTPAPRKARTSRATANAPAAPRYRGRNHVWMPALRIDRSIAWYDCSNQSYPGDRVYRWGCAGRKNVYLFGHAHSVFKKLHSAYVGGRLKKGMKLFYADSDGDVHAYRLAWWKVTTPTAGTWAYKAQSRSSLTLQTCVGARSQYRLIVRFVEVD